jgi:hypothetical protein
MTVPAPSAKCFRNPGVDFLRNFNVISLVVELPRAMLAGPGGKLGIIRVYATTSIQEHGRWTQVERLARPAVKEAFQSFEGHDRTNRSSPWADPTLPHDIIAFMASKRGANRSMALAKAVEKTLIPDEIQADISASGPARYLAVETGGKTGLPVGIVRLVPAPGIQGIKKALGDPYRGFGGRDPSSPVMDLSLGIVFGSLGQKVGLAPNDMRETQCLTSDNVDAGKRGVSMGFPYIGNPI